MLIFTNIWEKTSGSLAALFVCQALYRLYNQNNKLKGSKKGYANTHMIQWMYFLWVWTKWNESIFCTYDEVKSALRSWLKFIHSSL